jgi:hypothetical protein
VPKGTYEKIMCEAEGKYLLEEETICKAIMLTHLNPSRKIIAADKGYIDASTSDSPWCNKPNQFVS